MFDLEKREKAIILILLAVLLTGLLFRTFHRPNRVTDLKIRQFDYDRSDKEREKININEAGEETLAGLDGIGPSVAKRIVEYRAENGYFRSIEELKKIKGIGNKLLEKIKDDISIE
jgi:comEA protein